MKRSVLLNIRDKYTITNTLCKVYNHENLKLVVFSRRWWRNDTYVVELTSTGWKISFGSIGGDCDTTGTPYLFEILKNDNINYPANLGGYMDWLWKQAKKENMSEKEIQEHLGMLGRWISDIEKGSPKGIWFGYA